jgi:hypothetical protein
MPLVNLAIAQPAVEPKPEDPKDKKPLTIRIHLLCDGTNNNKDNIAEREKFEAGVAPDSNSYKKFGKGKGSSYDNGRTNIASMEPHVVDGEGVGGYNLVVKVYVEGQGTLKFTKDNNMGLGMASGLTGVYQRARTGINDAIAALQEKLLNDKNPPEEFFIKQVDIDVFGFSRGAATARHAIHVITTAETITVADPSGYGAQTIVVTQPLFERLRLLGYAEMRANHIKIKFAGLYDTVVSVLASQLAPAWLANNTRDQQAVAKAEFALHLAAADEHRQDFPLHKIKSALDAGTGAEYYLPGVHSDIGGSYNLANDILVDKGMSNARIREVKAVGNYHDLLNQKVELVTLGHKEADVEIEATAWVATRAGRHASEGKLYVYRRISGVEYARPSDEIDRVINRGRVSDLKEDMKHLIDDGWYEPGQIVIDVDYVATAVRTAMAVINPIGALIDGSPKSGKLVTNRFGLTSGYCNIPLKIMVKHSREQKILIKGKLDQRADIILGTVPEFKNLEADIQKYMGSKGKTGSKPEDWLNIKTAESHHKGIKELRNKHLHMSSAFTVPVMDAGFTPRLKNNVRKRFYYEG